MALFTAGVVGIGACVWVVILCLWGYLRLDSDVLFTGAVASWVALAWGRFWMG